MKKDTIETHALYIRNFIFGVEDSLVSTVGLLSGVAAAGVTREEIFVTGIILIFVEAFSMGVGSYLSENFTEDYTQAKTHFKLRAIMASAIMFVSYFIAGFIPLSPYIFFQINQAFAISNIFSLAALFTLGALSAKIFHLNVIKHSLKMFIMGGFAIAIGFLVGKYIHLPGA